MEADSPFIKSFSAVHTLLLPDNEVLNLFHLDSVETQNFKKC